jgi:hypothetical protein
VTVGDRSLRVGRPSIPPERLMRVSLLQYLYGIRSERLLMAQLDYGEASYAALTWAHRRRVIIKAEVTCHPGREPKDNPRFVVTNLAQSSMYVYEKIYWARGDVENRIKELHLGLEIDRTSCHASWPISCGSSSPPLPLSSCRNFGYAPPALLWREPKPRCLGPNRVQPRRPSRLTAPPLLAG